MLTTQNIPNKFRFSIGRKLIGIPQKMIKTVLTVLTAFVKGDVKSRNSILGFTAILKDFHSGGDLAVFISRQKQKQIKKQQQKTRDPLFLGLEVTSRVASFMSYDFLFVEQELGALQTILQNKQIKSH